jgi:hypothetical protein
VFYKHGASEKINFYVHLKQEINFSKISKFSLIFTLLPLLFLKKKIEIFKESGANNKNFNCFQKQQARCANCAPW